MTGDTAAARCTDRELVADLFHALSQPLTSLRCSMEVALLETRPVKHYEQVLHQSLELAERLAGLVGGIRNLLEADQAMPPAGSVSLADCLEEIAGDLLPVAESGGKTLLISTVPCQIRFDLQRLRQALLSLLECALNSGDAGSEIMVQIRVQTEAREAVLRLTVAPRVAVARQDPTRPEKHSPDRGLRRRVAMAISRRSFEAGGGRFFMQQAAGSLLLEVRLPLCWPE